MFTLVVFVLTEMEGCLFAMGGNKMITITTLDACCVINPYTSLFFFKEYFYVIGAIKYIHSGYIKGSLVRDKTITCEYSGTS